MNKILKISLVMAVVLTALNAAAVNPDFSLDLKKVEGRKVSFTLKEMKKVKLSIYDSNDVLIFKEDVAASGNMNRTYDLTGLPDGDYYLETESNLKIMRYKIAVVGTVAKLSTEAVSEVYKPVFLLKDGKVTMNLLNMNEVPVTVKVLDAHDLEVHKETYASGVSFGKVFNMKKFEGKKCTFLISYDGNTYEKTIVL